MTEATRNVRGRTRTRRPAWVLVALLLLVAVVVCGLGLFLWPRSHRDWHRTCLGHLEMLSLAIAMYANDADMVLPSAQDWPSLVSPYNRSAEALRCPAAPNLGVGYLYLDGVAGRPWKDVTEPAYVLMLCDGDPASGQPALRHDHGLNVAYADCHVKWLSREGLLRELARGYGHAADAMPEPPGTAVPRGPSSGADER